MSSELQERIARAMAAKRRDLIARPLADIWLELALSAMEAMREPTDLMLEAGWNAYGECGEHYTAMLDAEIQAAEGADHD